MLLKLILLQLLSVTRLRVMRRVFYLPYYKLLKPLTMRYSCLFILNETGYKMWYDEFCFVTFE